MLDLYQELTKVIDALARLELPYALAGGIAVSLYTRPRATEDIDLMIREQDWEAVRASMGQIGYTVEANPMSVANERLMIRRLTKLAGEDFLILDFLVPQTKELGDILDHRTHIRWQGRDLSIVTVEDLKYLKRLRDSLQDQADIEALEGKAET